MITLDEFHKKYGRLPRLDDVFTQMEVERGKMSKFKFLDYPVMAPGRCINCGGMKPDRKYVDFGFSIDGYGAVYFCTFCLKEIFDLLNYVPSYKSDIEGRKSIVKSLESLGEELNRMHSELRSKIKDISNDLSNVRFDPDSVRKFSTDISSDERQEGSNDKRSITESKRVNKQNNESRSEDFSGLAELGFSESE